MTFVPRTVFPKYNIPLANFKGHHQKALSKFGHLAPQIDLVLEIRDSRAPFTTTNVLFDKVLAKKPKLILYSKKDLSVLNNGQLERWHDSKHEEYLTIDCRSKKDTKKIINVVSEKYLSMYPPPPLGLRLMIIGMPNVGKSSLVNSLRSVGYSSKLGPSISSKNRKVAQTGGQPGVTRSTSEIIRISKDPDILVHDTPGVFLPSVKDDKAMLTLALVGCVDSSYIDAVVLADYLLFLLNLQDKPGTKYKEYLKHPTNSIDELLYNISLTRNKVKPDGSFDKLGAAIHWVNLWRQGKEQKYKGLFDLNAITDLDVKDLTKNLKQERQRVEEMKVSTKINERLGLDGTGTDKNRRRNAKDREYDLRNTLFRL